MVKKKKKKRNSNASDLSNHESSHAGPLKPTPAKTEPIEECRVEQLQEVEALEAIYGPDFEHRSSTTIDNDHIAFSIRISVAEEDQKPKEIVLFIQFNRCYPILLSPSVSIESSIGLTDEEVKELTDRLINSSYRLIGQVMVFELITESQEYLSDLLDAEKANESSFFEQMIDRQKKLEKEKAKEEQLKQEIEQKQAMEEHNKLQELIENAMEQKDKNRTPKHEPDRNRNSSIDDNFSESEDEEEVTLDRERHPFSRYHNDFKELGILGAGGGGTVIKVQNLLDRQLYAVKKIDLDPRYPIMKKKILREVKTISRLQHRHIVRYFQAWLEGGEHDQQNFDDEDDTEWFENDSSDERGQQNEDDEDWFGTNSSVSHQYKKFDGDLNSAYSLHDDEEADKEWAAMEEASEGFLESSAWEWDVDNMENRSDGKTTAPRRHERLYIQMEYCRGKTLREVIDRGELSKDHDKVWRLFRQVLEAVAYIHSKGLIHRDIKPPNIFLDAEGSVKLGDFGLAKKRRRMGDSDRADSLEREDAADSQIDFAPSYPLDDNTISKPLERTKLQLEALKFEGIDDSITAGVGTTFYRAPEQEREGQHYNQKADLYSLGVLLFEMWSPPFTTLMERAEALIELRNNSAYLENFEEMSDKHRKTIQWLCSWNPVNRPTAAELLESNLLPPKMEVESTYLKEALVSLANPEGTFFHQMLEALFRQEPMDHVDYTYDLSLGGRKRSAGIESRIRSEIQAAMQSIFARHGAIDQLTPLLTPRKSTAGRPKEVPSICTLLDATGVPVHLPFNLTEPFARYVARHDIRQIKRFGVGRVYRKNKQGGQPRELWEVDFDIVWDNLSPRILELETCQVMFEVLQSVSPYIGPYYLRFNNSKVVRSLLGICDIPPSSNRELLRLLSQESPALHGRSPSKAPAVFNAGSWKYIYKKLKEMSLSDPIIELLKPFFFLPENCLAALYIIEISIEKLAQGVLNTLRPTTASDTMDEQSAKEAKRIHKRQVHVNKLLQECKDGLSTLRLLLQGIEYLQLTGPICYRVDLGFSPREHFYSSGLVFQAILVSDDKKGKDLAGENTIAEGGRYDNLLQSYRLPAARINASSTAAVGVRFALDKIVSCALMNLSERKKMMVLVCAAGRSSDTLLQRIEVATLLWNAGITCEFLHPDFSHLEDIEEYCGTLGFQWMVIVKKHMTRDKIVKVRAVKNLSVADITINSTSLIEFFSDKIATEKAVGVGGGAGVECQVATEKTQGFEVRILDSKHQQKDRQNRAKEVQNMERRVSKWADNLLGNGTRPTRILCSDVPFSLLREFATNYMAGEAETTIAKHSRCRKGLKYLADELREIEAEAREASVREDYVILYSSTDDRYDLVSVFVSR